MDKPVSLWFIFLNIIVIIGVSYAVYRWLKSIKGDF
ncbi:glutamyl-tRNA amidotransferase [Nautilia profundicola]|nr:glutamyl-tRNA amidotransferase [Nautilia profundicola]